MKDFLYPMAGCLVGVLLAIAVMVGAYEFFSLFERQAPRSSCCDRDGAPDCRCRPLGTDECQCKGTLGPGCTCSRMHPEAIQRLVFLVPGPEAYSSPDGEPGGEPVGDDPAAADRCGKCGDDCRCGRNCGCDDWPRGPCGVVHPEPQTCPLLGPQPGKTFHDPRCRCETCCPPPATRDPGPQTCPLLGPPASSPQAPACQKCPADGEPTACSAKCTAACNRCRRRCRGLLRRRH